VHDAALVVDADQVTDANLVEAHAKRVHPEQFRVLRIASGHVPGDAFGESELAEHPERDGEVALALLAFFLDRQSHGRNG
jgi:hypothetical protein